MNRWQGKSSKQTEKKPMYQGLVWHWYSLTERKKRDTNRERNPGYRPLYDTEPSSYYKALRICQRQFQFSDYFSLALSKCVCVCVRWFPYFFRDTNLKATLSGKCFMWVNMRGVSAITLLFILTHALTIYMVVMSCNCTVYIYLTV